MAKNNTALMKVRQRLSNTSKAKAALAKRMKGTEGGAGAAKAAAAGATTGALITALEQRLPRLHPRLPHSAGVAILAGVGAAMTKGDTSRGLSLVCASATAIATDDVLAGMMDGDDGADAEESTDA